MTPLIWKSSKIRKQDSLSQRAYLRSQVEKLWYEQNLFSINCRKDENIMWAKKSLFN